MKVRCVGKVALSALLAATLVAQPVLAVAEDAGLADGTAEGQGLSLSGGCATGTGEESGSSVDEGGQSGEGAESGEGDGAGGSATQDGGDGAVQSDGSADDQDTSAAEGQPDEDGLSTESDMLLLSSNGSNDGSVSDASVVKLNQQSFDAAGGLYTITQSGTFELEENVTGAFLVNINATGQSVTLKLNGHTVTNPSTSSKGVLTVDTATYVYVYNGTIEQQNQSNAAVRASKGGAYVLLNGVNASSVNHTCIDDAGGRVNIQSGRYKLTITDEKNKGEALITLGNGNCAVAVTGGNFSLNSNFDTRTIVKNVRGVYDANHCVSISGGNWSDFPAQASLPYNNETYAMVARKSESEDGEIPLYSVMETYWARRAAVCYLKSGTNFRNIYFESKADAIAWAKAHGLSEDDIVDVFKVTFDTDGGVDENGQAVASWTVDVNYGEKVNDPKLTLYKEGYFFKGWVASGEEKSFPTYDFANRQVYTNLTLKPIWKKAAAVVDGTYYETLQQAIEANPLAEGTFFFKAKDDYYRPRAYSELISDANYVVSWSTYDTKVYFADKDEATAFAQEDPKNPKELKAIYHVRLLEDGRVVETRHLEEGEALGALPQAKQVSGYTFAGWYVNETKVDATYVPTSSDDVVAMWAKDAPSGSDDTPDEPTDSPTDNPADASKDGSADKAIPQTGDAANAACTLATAGAVLAAAGLTVVRRRRR